jgi:ABC-type branched-subunit amino acid transport system substrate-binding protein
MPGHAIGRAVHAHLRREHVRNKILPRVVAVAVISAVAVASAGPAGAAAPAADPGVSKSEIVTGPASPGYKDVAPAAKAYFDYVNSKGGINGRKIKLVIKDDQYNPALTRKVTNELILQDKIFALFGALGTPTHSTVIQDLNRRGIPDVWINTGGASFDNPKKYPTTFPGLPSYIVEAKAMAAYIQGDAALNAKTKCLMYQDGEFGENAQAGFAAAGLTFATTTSYFSGQQGAPFTAQVTKMAQAKCDLVIFFGVTSATAQLLGTAARAGFKPTWMVTSVGSDPSVLAASLGASTNALLNGVYTNSFLVPIQDTTNPYVSQMKAIADANGLPWNFYTYFGINTAYVFAQALKAAGPNLTRQGLIDALQTKASTFRSAAVVPMNISATSHQGLTGYWVGRYDANGVVQRLTPYILTATNATKGTAKQATFKPGNPTKLLLP